MDHIDYYFRKILQEFIFELIYISNPLKAERLNKIKDIDRLLQLVLSKQETISPNYYHFAAGVACERVIHMAIDIANEKGKNLEEETIPCEVAVTIFLENLCLFEDMD